MENAKSIHTLTAEAVELLKEMVAIPSPSFSEDAVCTHICNWLTDKGIVYNRVGNNIIAGLSWQKASDKHPSDKYMEGHSQNPTLMLCAHIDTVAPCEGYTFDPHNPDYTVAAEAVAKKISDGEISADILKEHGIGNVMPEDIVAGLGSNDDGASAVSMIAAFRYFGDRFFAGAQQPTKSLKRMRKNDKGDAQQPTKSLKRMRKNDKGDVYDGASERSINPCSCSANCAGMDVGEKADTDCCAGMDICNLILVLSCEEERSGLNGMTGLWSQLKDKVDYAIVGEPTGMKAATAERGLLVIDATAHGVSGHAARNEGINAIEIAIQDIQTLKSHTFEKVSPRMGKVNLNVTQINAGTAHNVIPDTCTFVIDIRPTEQYTNEEILKELQSICKSELRPRNLSNRSSATRENSRLQHTAEALGIETFSSPTTSDWMRIDCDAIKMGPGESSRSHKKDEFVFVDEIAGGIRTYIDFIENF